MALKRKMIKNLGYGLPAPLIPLAPEPIISDAAPTNTDEAERGQIVVTDANTVHIYAGKLNGASVWKEVAGDGPATFTTVDASTSVTTPILTVDSSNLAISTTTTGDLTLNAADAFTIDSTKASTITVTGAGENLTLSSNGGSLEITATEASGSAIAITASDVAGGINIVAGTGGMTATVTGGDIDFTADSMILNGVHIYTGAGAPAAGLALAAGDLYINTTPTGAADRMFIASAANSWTNFTTAA